MIPCDWIGIVTMRSETRCSTSTNGMISRRPGSRMPTTRPRRNSTPSSYCLTILTQRENEHEEEHDDDAYGDDLEVHDVPFGTSSAYVGYQKQAIHN